MNELNRMKLLMTDLFNGDPWLEVTLQGTLSKVTAATAARKLHPTFNSIWEIVNHLIEWRKNVLSRINGMEITTPDHNYFHPVENQSEPAWQQTLSSLAATQVGWSSFLEEMPLSDMDKVYAPNGITYFKHIHGIIQHDAYHLGQIVLLMKNS